MNEPVRLLADWLKDPTDGVAALLATVPRDPGDPLPTGPITVLDETRDESAAPGHFPDPGTGIALTVQMTSGLAGDNRAAQNSGHGSWNMLVRIGLRNTNTANAKRDGNYVLRATLWSLRKYRNLDPNSAPRTRNNFRLLLPEEVQVLQWWETIEDTLVSAALLVPFASSHDFGLS